ncbi:MAG: 50S ribosomal protein L33 [Candidatus Yanofskybacteria bacterium RIFCSPLOWO2_01_FULL_49_25]|uniref:Large ribosomal subunit protein bL33 n=1 Tax=Candidatus Yanofskybacteria bacterium RIFCSPLOWO2_01_FULL_49_25 TaxID=1802701 RepID=A0A1F8GRF0_9BACT|nr:MAG: 50S ribosomal protein L33 [Candidatus Yanofskybacteria bacterium RIFCSPLOWO2_01_FULL_49_25]
MSQDNLIKVKCTVCKRGVYYSSKNKKLVTRKLEFKKYCKVCRKHTNFKETKLNA